MLRGVVRNETEWEFRCDLKISARPIRYKAGNTNIVMFDILMKYLYVYIYIFCNIIRFPHCVCINQKIFIEFKGNLPILVYVIVILLYIKFFIGLKKCLIIL